MYLNIWSKCRYIDVIYFLYFLWVSNVLIFSILLSLVVWSRLHSIRGLLKKNKKKLTEFYNFKLRSINDVHLTKRIFTWGRHNRMVVGFTTTYAISAYHHWCCEFECRPCRGVQYYVIKFVCDLRQVCCFLLVLLFTPPIKLTAK